MTTTRLLLCSALLTEPADVLFDSPHLTLVRYDVSDHMFFNMRKRPEVTVGELRQVYELMPPEARFFESIASDDEDEQWIESVYVVYNAHPFPQLTGRRVTAPHDGD